jgi:hypothetical protein
LFALAGHLGMTVRELSNRMDSRELTEWYAYVHHFRGPLDEPWHQTGVIASACLSPYTKPGKRPKPSDFIPVTRPPQHETQLQATMEKLIRKLGGAD